jgi:acetyl esterase/lipase
MRHQRDLARVFAWSAGALALAGGSLACGGTGDEPATGGATTLAVTSASVRYLAGYDRAGAEPTMLRVTPDGDGTWPVIVLLHGGGMDAGGMTWLAETLAEQGAVVYVPTYRHAFWGVGVAQVESGEWPGETLLGDIACAVRVARADASGHGGDADRVTIVGYSMGAAFGATVALRGDDPDLAGSTSGPCANDVGSGVPDAFVGWEGPYDWDQLGVSELADIAELAPDVFHSLGPVSSLDGHPGGGEVPFHLFAGDQLYRSVSHADHLATFAAALADGGWPVTSEVLPDRSHTDLITAPGIAEVNEQILAIARNPR